MAKWNRANVRSKEVAVDAYDNDPEPYITAARAAPSDPIELCEEE